MQTKTMINYHISENSAHLKEQKEPVLALIWGKEIPIGENWNVLVEILSGSEFLENKIILTLLRLKTKQQQQKKPKRLQTEGPER